MLSLVSTLPVFDQVYLIHTISSVWNRFKLHNISSRLARYTSKHRDNFSYHIKYFLILSNFRTKEGGEALGNFMAVSQACMRPRRREALPNEEEKEDHGLLYYRGRMAPVELLSLYSARIYSDVTSLA